jgi:uncharacterized protein YbcC (UPF0753/DUF2309 family)
MTSGTLHSPGQAPAENLAAPLSPTWLDQLLNEVFQPIPPLWPLADFVAVNPWANLTEKTLLEVHQSQQAIQDCDLLPAWSVLQTLWQQRQFSAADTRAAFEQLSADATFQLSWQQVQETLTSLNETTPPPATRVRQYWTVSDYLDRDQRSSWSSHILNDVTRTCAAHFDEGQALWASPWQELSLYDAWRETAQRSRRMEWLNFSGFRQRVTELPMSPRLAIVRMLESLAIPRDQWGPFLEAQLASVFGWASYLKYQAEFANPPSIYDDLSGLLAIRLAYDLCLQQRFNVPVNELYPSQRVHSHSMLPGDSATSLTEAKLRYVLVRASELAYQEQLLSSWQDSNSQRIPYSTSELPKNTILPHKRVQMVFCIDVRSEVLRRHLEAIDSHVETYGFAGFFAMPIEHVSLGDDGGVSQCPVLLKPIARVQDQPKHATPEAAANLVQRSRDQRLFQRCWKYFQKSSLSTFAFVEGLGWTYAIQLLKQTVGSMWPQQLFTKLKPAATIVAPAMLGRGTAASDSGLQVDLAANLLKNLGLTQDFAPLVVICGHACDVTNNPYRAGLDCGACGGHSGEPNARFAAALLNRVDIRAKLAQRGINIPDTTWFIPALHRTTTDVVELLDLDDLPYIHEEQCQELQQWLEEAGERVRQERVRRMGDCSTRDVFRRSLDWSEVRPEWGLAGNSAFIVAPRSLTRRLNLKGQAFLHSYEHERDPEGSVLEMIMTAPMIVASWINLQYYASTVDNKRYGSGNKLLHNVTGQFGILEGNGGDLRFGLPWQSVADGQALQHLPRRLSVVIQAPRSKVHAVMNKHASVQQLIQNQWIGLVVVDEGLWYRWVPNSGWVNVES